MGKGIIIAITASLLIGGGVVAYTILGNNSSTEQKVVQPITTVKTVQQNQFIEEKKEKEAIVIKFSHIFGENTPFGKTITFFEKELEKVSKGEFDVQVYPDSKLYNNKTVLKAIKFNNVQMAMPSYAKLTDTIPQLAVFSLPFIFKDTKHVYKVFDGKVGIKIKKLASKKAFHALDFWGSDFKQIASSVRPLKSPEDAKGQRFRIMSSDLLKDQFEALDAKPMKMAYKDVKNALDNDLIDGQENTISNMHDMTFYKSQKYLTISNHGYLGHLLIISNKFWDSLTDEQQELIDYVVHRTKKYQREQIQLKREKDLKNIKDYAEETGNLSIYKLTKEDRIKWMNKLKHVYPKYYDEKKIGKDLILEVMRAK